jgi:hypothetical protein
MTFLNSLPLWGGLAALAVSLPILIHLWSRRQKIEIRWAAMELLKKAMVTRSQQIRMEDRLLLLLRCLTLLLIALALLRPLFNAGHAGGAGGAGVVIGIDASYSMGHGEPARFEEALTKAREILSTLKEGDLVSIVLMSSDPKVLFRRTGYAPGSFATALEQSATVSARPLNLERNLEMLLELCTELKTASRECHIITDAQTTDWQALSDQSRSTLQALGEKANVLLTPVAAPRFENLALTDLSYSAGSLQRDGSARFSAGVRNMGSQVADGASVEFFVNGKLKSRETLGSLAAGESGLVSFFTSFDAAGDIALSARLSRDGLQVDNERHAIAGIRSSVRVLCLDGEMGQGTGQDVRGAFYAIRALRLKYAEERAPIRVTHIDPAGVHGEKLNDFDVIMMFNVAEVNEALGKRIGHFIENGGGLMVFLGDKVDPERYNTAFIAKGKPVLPLRLLKTVHHKTPAQGWQIAPPQSDHVLAQLVGRLPNDVTAEARFHGALGTELLKDGHTILALDNGLPLLVGSRTDRIMVFTSSADRTWNNLPVHPLFMILLQQSATMLSSTAEFRRGIVGEASSMPLPGRLMDDEVVLKNPAGESTPVRVTVSEGATAVVITPVMPGVYQIDGERGLPGASIAANVDVRESDLRTAGAPSLSQWLDGMPVTIVTSSVADAALNSRTGRDLSLTLLVLGVICLSAQGLLANHLSRRKHAGGSVADRLQDRRVAASRRS